ncbi:hypothetical protein MSHI_27010 [Mycobacterium shinjukuense]|uniref:Uncharacterized protein n=1 Tax=Mycobacterium shinjukuense TaxID=398694 RepID=A0A7I7MRF9_9MYCO|nr:hypothetical protein MSHI_27010 [Mycobacterium shinjukuense]
MARAAAMGSRCVEAATPFLTARARNPVTWGIPVGADVEPIRVQVPRLLDGVRLGKAKPQAVRLR